MENSNTVPINIMLADDDKDDCLLFKEALNDLPLSYQLTIVNDGEQLMQQLNEIHYSEKMELLPFLIFLDLNMPRKNGFECLKEIKEDEWLNPIPVIIFSTCYDQNIANKLYDSGAHYYICKPAEFSHLKRIIHHSVNLISIGKNKQPPKENFLLSNLKTLLF